MATNLLKTLSLPVLKNVPTGGSGESAVLVSLATDSAEEEWILLTKRTQWVETHKGQISFPGGFWHTSDSSLLETALRETEEEIGLVRSHLQILGSLDVVVTRGSVRIHPFVGVFKIPYAFNPSEDEVERILMLPLSRLVREKLVDREIEIAGRKILSPAIEVEGELVWGATARILEQLIQKFRP